MLMTMEIFCNTIKTNIQARLGSDFCISLKPILKNNDTRLTGLIIMEEGCSISPTIYLDFYYQEYMGGRTSLKEIEHGILERYRSSRLPNGRFDFSRITEWERAKPMIACKLVNYNDNQELLATVPHERFLDLAVVCYYLVDADSSAAILIHDRFLGLWGRTQEEVIQAAKENTPRLLTENIQGIMDIIAELTGIPGICGLDVETDRNMYVLTNQNRTNGSICILYPNLLKDFADKIQDDLYIIPSSVHEVLLVPAGKTTVGSAELSKMVQDVNRTQVERDETLSDHVYYYSRTADNITM